MSDGRSRDRRIAALEEKCAWLEERVNALYRVLGERGEGTERPEAVVPRTPPPPAFLRTHSKALHW